MQNTRDERPGDELRRVAPSPSDPPVPSVTRSQEESFRGRLSFAEAVAEVAEHIHADRLLTVENQRTVSLVIRVMADMMIKSPYATVYIEGEPMFARDVWEAYQALDEQAIAEVLDRLSGVEMVRAKAYLRTVLYNAAIENGE